MTAEGRTNGEAPLQPEGLLPHPFRHRRAMLAGDVGVGVQSHESQMDGARRLRRTGTATQGRAPAGNAEGEDIGEGSGVLPRDQVAVGRGRHCRPQVDPRRLGDVMLRGLSQPGRQRHADGREGIGGIGDAQPIEHPRQPQSQRFPLVAAQRGGGERRQQQDDAEIGVAAGNGPRRLDGMQDRFPHPAARRGEDRGDGSSAVQELRHAHTMAFGMDVNVAGLQRHQLQPAGGENRLLDQISAVMHRGRQQGAHPALRASTDTGEADARRARTRSASDCATSTGVTA